MNGAVYLLIAIVGEVIATSFLRASAGFTQIGPSIIVVLGYCVTFYFFSLALQTIPVGVGYAIWSGVGIVLISWPLSSCMARPWTCQQSLALR